MIIDYRQIICNGGSGGLSITVLGGTWPYQSSLNGGPYTQTLIYSGLPAASYNVTVRDASLCETPYPDNPVVLTDPPPITIDSLSVTDVAGCYGDNNGSIYVEASGGWNYFSYALQDSVYQTGNLFTGLYGGNDTLYIQDSLGCVIVLDTITIDQPTQITLDIVTTPVMGPNPGTITIAASGGTPGYTYSIILDEDTTTNKTGFFGGLGVGIYGILVEDTLGCFVTDTAEITKSELSVFIDGFENVTCYGYMDGGFDFYIVPIETSPPFIVSLMYSTDTLTYTIGSFNGSFAGQLGADTYHLHIEDVAGSEFDTTLVITQPPPIEITSDITNVSCTKYIIDGSIELTVTGGVGGFSYQWYRNSIPFSNDTNLYDIGPGYYEIQVTDDSSCTATEGYIVEVLDSVDVDAGEDGRCGGRL